MSSEKSSWETLVMLQDALRTSPTIAEVLRRYFPYVKAPMDKTTSRDSVEEGGSKIKKTGSNLFLRCIIQPYAVKTFKAKTKICGPLARCLLCFLRGITEAIADAVWSILLRNKQYKEGKISVEEVLKEPKGYLELETESAERSVAILVSYLLLMAWSLKMSMRFLDYMTEHHVFEESLSA